jgi:predicted nucleic acid-binding protein
VEVDQLLGRRGQQGAFRVLLEDIAAAKFRLLDLTGDDYVRAGVILGQYPDFDIGFVDAAVLAIVERLNEPKLATLDRRHFSVLRPRHVDALQLLP